MAAIRRILISIKDPAHGVTPAAQKGAQLARATGAELELFHAITLPIYLDNYRYSDTSVTQIKREMVQRCTQQLERIARALTGNGRQRKLKVRINASWDYPSYAAISCRAATFKADLVIADRHAGRHFARAVMHFADWELLRYCSAPVLLVGAKDVYRRPVLLAAVDPAHRWGKPARLDARILSMGIIFSAALRGKLHAVHAFESVPVGMAPFEGMDANACQELADRLTAGATSRFQHTLRGSRIAQRHRHLVDAPAVLGITKLVDETKAELLILGCVSRSALTSAMIGSTAETLLDRVGCDLLIVKPAGFKPPFAQAEAGARVIPQTPPMTK